MAPLTHLTSDDFEIRVLHSDQPVVVEFGAPWCGPCKLLEPVLEELAQLYAGQVEVFLIDVDHAPDLAMQYGVMGVPTVILFRAGEPETQITGYRPKQILEKTFFSTAEQSFS